jgi:acetyltransferase
MSRSVIDASGPQRYSLDAANAVFSPRSVAVLGVTNTPGTVPHDIFLSILSGGFKGVVFPVAPNKSSIAGVKAYNYITDISDAVDLAVIVFPSHCVHLALEQCGQKGVKAAVIISAGFREVGPKGVEREGRIKEIARKYNIALIGPNCLGVINTDKSVSLNASFARQMPAEGNIGFLSQSGALCTAVLDYARGKKIGFSKFVSFGNKAGLSELDLMYYMAEDEATKVILMYLEEMQFGTELIELARYITSGSRHPKPILAIKSGKTAQGAAAAASHTGSLAGADVVCDGVFRQAGIIRVDSIEEMFNAATMFAYQPLARSNRIAIVTNAGGPGVMATDAAVQNDLSLARFEETTTGKLKQSLPSTANIKNPVDVIGDARDDRYSAALEAVLADDNVDQTLVILTPQSMTNIEATAKAICRATDQHARNKAVACSFMGGYDVAAGISILESHRIPHYILPEQACRAFSQTVRYRNWLNRPKAEQKQISVDKEAAGKVIEMASEGYLSEIDATTVLKAYGFPVVEPALVKSAAEAAAAANRMGYPVVLRVLSPDIVHKFDVGGVVLNLKNADEVHQAYLTMMQRLKENCPDAEIKGVLVRKMIPAGKEVILGLNRDPVFGHVIMFGLGGIYVEIFKDVTFRLAPIDPVDASGMVREIKAVKVLEGARGEAPSDIAAIEECLLRLSQLAVDFRRIAEMDINPLIVHSKGTGAHVADVRIRVADR